MIKISYAITVCDELLEIERITSVLISEKRSEDSIFVLFDSSKGSKEVRNYLEDLDKKGLISLFIDRFTDYDSFADWKNLLNSKCDGDWIFQIDADEQVTPEFISILHILLDKDLNSDIKDIDLLAIPRINTVEGITEEHIKKWNWVISEHFEYSCVNFPDYQMRLYRNKPDIKWFGSVHERIVGHSKIAIIPVFTPDWCLHHHKTIKKQESQNEFYENWRSK